ncbi:MAG: gamma-glutamyltransferase family protein [Saprospiraceae bacterium]
MALKKIIFFFSTLCLVQIGFVQAQSTQKPVIHGKHWMAITGKPLAATAGATVFQQGGNAVDAACAMLAATATMWDVLSWGGETQALIYNPRTGKVMGVNALGVAPTGATPAFYKSKGYDIPPAYGPLAAVTPGTPGGLFTMLSEFGTMSLAQVLKPAMQMAEGYPMETSTADMIEKNKGRIKNWPYSKKIFLPHLNENREAPEGGEIFVQKDLFQMLSKLVDAESSALKQGKSRKEAIQAAYDRFYRGDIAVEFVRGVQEQGGLITLEDLAKWKVKLEEPVSVNYRGIDVYKLTTWTQGPVMLQALNILENFDLKSMGYNSSRYIHTICQAMHLAFADRDFYYGDPDFLPSEPINGLLSKAYAKERAKSIQYERNDTLAGPGDPYPFEQKVNPFKSLLEKYKNSHSSLMSEEHREGFFAGTTSIETADAEGWVVSVTPSGGWIPACVAGNTGIGLSQRMQAFVLDGADNPFNVLEPGKRPRVTLTPTLALRNNIPFVSFAVQGGDSQDQNLLQFFLNMVEFDMNVQEACEAPNVNSFQMKSSFDKHLSEPGRLLVNEQTPDWTRRELKKLGYLLEFDRKTSGPINAIYFDHKHGSFWGGSSHFGEDYGIGW